MPEQADREEGQGDHRRVAAMAAMANRTLR
jgi:hypothetical protein